MEWGLGVRLARVGEREREVQGLRGKGGGGIIYRDEEAQGGRVRPDPPSNKLQSHLHK